ncbi:hypothetical protein [Nevskia sp.]|uniref:hypothetical protein n=1 Tax=Nevskia sp. TaxID=1929292 RepID=UPI0025E8CC47|nr:hypothetical protein [Nevskia sp.]
MRRLRAAGVIALALLASPANAHEGHRHDDDAEAHADSQADEHSGAERGAAADKVLPAAPAVSASTPKLELVLKRDAQRLLIYLDDFATNAPLAGLAVSVRANGHDIGAEAIEPGTYSVPLDLLPPEDAAPITVRVHGAAGSVRLDESIATMVPLPADNGADDEAIAAARPTDRGTVLKVIGGLVVAVLAAFAARALRRRKAGARRRV